MAVRHSLVNTTFPVHLPEMPELKLSNEEFQAAITQLLHPSKLAQTASGATGVSDIALRLKHDFDSPGAYVPEITTESLDSKPSGPSVAKSAFMDALLSNNATMPTFDERDGKMRTDNTDVAYRTSGEVLVDLFHELEDVVSGDRLSTLLKDAWSNDADATLKIIWNARSIHLGKSSRNTFYRAIGWVAENHPATLLVNLPWLVRPLIQKKAPKPDEKKDASNAGVNDERAEIVEAQDADSDFELIEGDEEVEGQPKHKKAKIDEDSTASEFDVKYGVAHGYWKDLLNILVLAANDQLTANGDVRSVFNSGKPSSKPWKRDWTAGRGKVITTKRHDRVVKKLAEDPFYRSLHLTVARLFADQLKADVARLQTGSKREKKMITLAAKWAPSTKGMHDQHTCIVSSIAEVLYPLDTISPRVDPGDRSLYLKYAREAYQTKTLSPLRKHLEVVERSLTAQKYGEIKYERVPSLAMKQYTTLFAKKDFDRFDKYIENVAQGQARISGATLLPSTLVAEASGRLSKSQGKGTKGMVEQKLRQMQQKSLNGQWNTLVQRIKESGTLESSIAVCDVSGSMLYPRFPDGTCPMDSAVGLSLLLADVTKPPFGGAFITFENDPQIVQAGGADDKRTLQEKVRGMETAAWGGDTNFVAVFERLILPMAIEHKLKQEDMVKQLFVFSDMQFGSAGGDGRWKSSYERIQEMYRKAGYEMPRLIFWNLAGGRAGYAGGHGGYTGSHGFYDGREGDETAPKPVNAAEEGTSLVNGYSQGQMKMFLDNGQFKDPEDEETVEVQEGDGDAVIVEKKVKKAKQDPLATVRKAISHEAYRMLKVID